MTGRIQINNIPFPFLNIRLQIGIEERGEKLHPNGPINLQIKNNSAKLAFDFRRNEDRQIVTEVEI